MRAVMAMRFGGDHPLGNLEVTTTDAPQPAAGESLVRVSMAALNRHDLFTLAGVSSRPLTQPQILGCDGAGVVEAVNGESANPPGTRVVIYAVMSCRQCPACERGEILRCPQFGLLSEPPYGGTMAEYIAVPSENLIALPDSVDDATAACLPVAYLTAYRMLFARGHVEHGTRVLIQGATGGVATAALLLARNAGAAVYVTSRTQAGRDFAAALGAAATFDPAQRSALKELKKLSEGGVDVVIETVGEPTYDFSLRALRPGGTVVVAGTTGGPNPPAQLHRIFWNQLTVAGSSMGSRAELEKLVAMCAAGELNPAVDSISDVADARTVFEKMASGAQHGKLVLRVR